MTENHGFWIGVVKPVGGRRDRGRKWWGNSSSGMDLDWDLIIPEIKVEILEVQVEPFDLDQTADVLHCLKFGKGDIFPILFAPASEAGEKN